jgi:hypothetical protein
MEEPTILVLVLAEVFMSMAYNLKQVGGVRHGMVPASTRGASVNALSASSCRQVLAAPRKGRRPFGAL